MIRHAMIFLAMTVAVPVPAAAGPAEDATAVVTTWLDKFNAGDVNAFKAAHAPNAVIVDEFGPLLWTGADAPQRWLDDYGKDSNAHGITGGRLDYAAPIRAESNGNTAYIVRPTIYRLQLGLNNMPAAGTFTLIIPTVANDWKIASWTYSAPAPK